MVLRQMAERVRTELDDAGAGLRGRSPGPMTTSDRELGTP
jgi:hypothetical protein